MKVRDLFEYKVQNENNVKAFNCVKNVIGYASQMGFDNVAREYVRKLKIMTELDIEGIILSDNIIREAKKIYNDIKTIMED